jgi:hypothetical protein
MATPRKDSPRNQRIHGPASRLPNSVPANPAAVWFAKVEKKIPKRIGTGRCSYHGQNLRLVANLGETDDHRRKEK